MLGQAGRGQELRDQDREEVGSRVSTFSVLSSALEGSQPHDLALHEEGVPSLEKEAEQGRAGTAPACSTGLATKCWGLGHRPQPTLSQKKCKSTSLKGSFVVVGYRRSNEKAANARCSDT